MLAWEPVLAAVRDTRRRPQIPTLAIVRAVVVMFLARLGSLNALEQSRPSSFWKRWLGRVLPSADSLGRVCTQIELADLRAVLRHVYTQLKRNKALQPPDHGLMAAVLDGHESHATYQQCCTGCLQRERGPEGAKRTQYYHRHVTLQLVGRDLTLLLDAEPLQPGEDEVAAALRLLDRVLRDYPRAFDVVVADALYADPRVVHYLLEHGKDLQASLKDNHPDLLQDARSLIEHTPPTALQPGGEPCQAWDLSGFTTWPQVNQPVRVVCSREEHTVRRQLDRQLETQGSQWLWVTTLSPARASTAAVIQLGHSRWSIENQGFNELVNHWHADHVYKHHPTAMMAFLLLAMLCVNVFVTFYQRNLKPAARQAASMLHVARQILAELYTGLPNTAPRGP